MMKRFALVSMTLLALFAMSPTASATTSLEECSGPTVDRAVCIVMEAAGPVSDLIFDEVYYKYGQVVEECRHHTSACPVYAVTSMDIAAE